MQSRYFQFVTLEIPRFMIKKIFALGTLLYLVTSLSAQVEKKVLIEIGTATWCAACPKSAVYAEELEKNFSGQYVVIKSHSSDPMENTAYNTALNLPGIPSGKVDRSLLSLLDPYDDLFPDMNDQLAITPEANVNLTVDYDEISRELQVTIEAEMFEDLSGDYRLAAIVKEDAVMGMGEDYDQNNTYSGDTDPMGGFENLPSIISSDLMSYNDVSRIVLGGYYGTQGSLPASLTAGETYSYSYSYDVPEEFNKDYINVAAYMVDVSTNKIVNCNESLYLNGMSDAKPIFNERNPLTAIQNNYCHFTIAAHDPDYDDLDLTLFSPLPSGLSFIDNGDGTASIEGYPLVNGIFEIIVGATDGVWWMENTFDIAVSSAYIDWIVFGDEDFSDLESSRNEILINSNGTKYIMGIDSEIERAHVFQYQTGYWVPLGNSLPTYSYHADLCLDSDGSPLYFSRGRALKWSGTSWQQIGSPLPDELCGAPRMIVNPYGERFLTYSGSSFSSKAFKYENFDWQEISTNGITSNFKKVFEIGPAGEVIMIYGSVLLLAKVWNGTNWENLGLNIDSGDSYWDYDIECTIDGEIYVCSTVNVTGSSSQVNLYRYNDDENEWDIVINGLGDLPVSNIELTSDSEGNVFIVTDAITPTISSKVFKYDGSNLESIGALGFLI